jgi:hypothetical protein
VLSKTRVQTQARYLNAEKKLETSTIPPLRLEKKGNNTYKSFKSIKAKIIHN